LHHVVEINSLDELIGYRADWNALFAATPRAAFFQTLDWLETYWTHFGGGQTLRVLIVYDDDRAIGILPLCIRRERYKLGNLRVLTYPFHNWGTYYGPIGPDRAVTLAAGLSHIRRTRRNWDLLDLRWADEQLDASCTPSAMCQAGFLADRQPLAEAGVIDLHGAWEEYLAARGSKFRNNLRRWERRLGERGELTHVRYRPAGEAQGDADPNWPLYDACEEIARRSWQGSSADGTTISSDAVRPFVRAAHAAAARLGMLDLNLLLVDGEPLAFAYNYQHGGLLQGLRVGLDPTRPSDGAGNLLYMRVIESSYRLGDRQYELGIGSLEAKRFIITHTETSYRYTHFPLSVRAQALRAKRVLKRWWNGRPERASRAQPA